MDDDDDDGDGDDDDDDDDDDVPMLNFIPDACSLFIHIRAKVSDGSNVSTITILQIVVFKVTVLCVLIMQSDISDERAAFVFRVTAWFKWLLKCLAWEYL
jgi:hypothetical protein